MSYQERDREVVDYQVYDHEELGLELRGPRKEPLTPGAYAVCVGAAQTYGCFCARPFPALLEEQLGMPVMNLGIGGAGPRFFVRADVLRILREARFVVLQVMSGRSESNSLFEAHGHARVERRSDGVSLFADRAWGAVFDHGARFWPFGPGRKIVDRLLATFGRGELRRLVAETRAAYVASYRELTSAIGGKTILLWFSVRTPEYPESYRNVYRLFGEFPHLIDRKTVAAVADLCDAYVEVVTSRGSPQPLVSLATGEPIAIDPGKPHAELGTGRLWTHNAYYPSPEMHEDVARALLPVCAAL